MKNSRLLLTALFAFVIGTCWLPARDWVNIRYPEKEELCGDSIAKKGWYVSLPMELGRCELNDSGIINLLFDKLVTPLLKLNSRGGLPQIVMMEITQISEDAYPYKLEIHLTVDDIESELSGVAFTEYLRYYTLIGNHRVYVLINAVQDYARPVPGQDITINYCVAPIIKDDMVLLTFEVHRNFAILESTTTSEAHWYFPAGWPKDGTVFKR